MSFEWLPDYHPGEDLFKASTVLSNWVQNYQQLQMEHQRLQEELATGQLRRAGLRIANEQAATQLGEFKETKNIRMQGLQTEQDIRQQQLSKETQLNQLAGKQLGRFDITAAKEDERHQIMMDTYKQELLKGGVDLETARKRLSQEEPLFKAQIDQLAAATEQSRTAVEKTKQDIKIGAGQQAWGSVFDAVKLSTSMPPEEYQKLQANPPDPSMAVALKAIPPGITDPNKALESFDVGLKRMALSGGKDAPAAIDYLTLLKTKELPTELLHKMTVDDMGIKTIQINDDVINKIKAGIETFSRSKWTPEQQKAADEANKPPPSAIPGEPRVLDPNSLPSSLRGVWALTQRYPAVSGKRFFEQNRDTDKGFNEVINQYRQIDPTAHDRLLVSNYNMGDVLLPKGLNEQNKYDPSNYERSSDQYKLGSRLPTGRTTLGGEPVSDSSLVYTGKGPLGIPGGQTMQSPLMKDPQDQETLDSLVTYDKTASTQQHLMYMALMREIAKKRNNKEPIGPFLDQTYRSLENGPGFFTPDQIGSISNLRRLFSQR